jgi:hypothetical protein
MDNTNEKQDTSPYKLDEFQQELEKGGKRIGTTSQKQVYDNLLKLFKEMSDDSASIEKLVEFVESSDQIVDFLDGSDKSDSSKRIIYYSLKTFSEIKEVDSNKYSEKFNELNKKGKSRGRRDILSDEKWQKCHETLKELLGYLPEELSADDYIKTIVDYRNTVLMILYLELPARRNDDYRNLRTRDEGKWSYYDETSNCFVYKKADGKLQVKVKIPDKYIKIVNTYFNVAKQLSDFFFFTEKGYKQFNSNNFSNTGKKIFQIELQSIRNKWKDKVDKCEDEFMMRRLFLELG